MHNLFLISINFAEKSDEFGSSSLIKQKFDDGFGEESNELKANELMHERKVKKKKKTRKNKDLTPPERKKRLKEKMERPQMKLKKQRQ